MDVSHILRLHDSSRRLAPELCSLAVTTNAPSLLPPATLPTPSCLPFCFHKIPSRSDAYSSASACECHFQHTQEMCRPLQTSDVCVRPSTLNISKSPIRAPSGISVASSCAFPFLPDRMQVMREVAMHWSRKAALPAATRPAPQSRSPC